MNPNKRQIQHTDKKKFLEWMYAAKIHGTFAKDVARSFLEFPSLPERLTVVQSAMLGWGAETEQAAKQVSDQAPTPALYKQNPCS